MTHNQIEPTEIGALLEALRSEVRARRLGNPSPADDGLQRDLQRALDEIELSRVVSAHWPLLGHTLPTRAVALVNKLVRRYLRWYINPIVEQQNAYNDAVARTLRLLAEAYADLAAQTVDSGRWTVDGDDGETRKHGDRETGRQGDREDADFRRSSFVFRLREATDNGQPTIDTLQTAIRSRAQTEPLARFPDLALRAQELQLQLRQNVNAHWPLPARSAPEKAVALVNKLVRRYLRWYINPIVEQQNAANTAISAALLAFVRLDAERRASIAARRVKAGQEAV